MLLTFSIIINYLALSIIQSLNILGKLSFSNSLTRLWSVAILVLHGFYLYGLIEMHGGQNLNAGLMLSLTFWTIGILIFLTFNEALNKLTPPTYILSAISIIIYHLHPKPDVVVTDQNLGMLFHILISLMATSVLLLCALQAAIVSVQSRMLKRALNHPVLKVLPPLMHMEGLLFTILSTGFALLTLSLLSGYLYIEDFFSLQLLPKTLLATLAWMMFGLILGARIVRGLRGQSAARLTGIATGLLFLSYFGTKFIMN